MIPGAGQRGAVDWMARNSVASNLLMVLLIVGGLAVGAQVKQEVFPEYDLEWVTINVPYPGASPEEVEEGILLSVEEAVRGVDGVKRVIATASEGMGSIWAELQLSADPTRTTADIKSAVDRITSFPRDAEEPVVSLMTNRMGVISLVISGEVSDESLKQWAERARFELLAKEEITTVEVSGARPREISIEIPQDKLREHSLTLSAVADLIRATSVDLPSGGVKTRAGEVLVRTQERRDFGREFADVVVKTSPEGANLLLGDIAHIRDGFADTDAETSFDGKPALMVDVFRVGDETPIEVAAAVKEYREELEAQLPPGMAVATWNDRSEIYQERIDLLLRNAYLGLILVLVILGLFLKPRLAFWVTMGIPISFAGSLLLMPVMGVSINMISLFAFIVTLGMVVDDAIVVGENIFEHRQRGKGLMKAAVDGCREVAGPVTFSILTTVAAFMPLFFVPGFTGKLFGVIPAVVVSVLLVSLIESIFVLPAHLGHEGPFVRFLTAVLRIVLFPLRLFFDIFRPLATGALNFVIHRMYKPSVSLAVDYRYATVGLGIATFLIGMGIPGSGRLGFTFMPKIESDRVVATAVLPFGSAVEDTREIEARLLSAAQAVIDESGGEVDRGVISEIGSRAASGGPISMTSGTSGGHVTNVQVFLVPLGQRDITAKQFVDSWRKKVGEVSGVESLTFQFSFGPSAGSPIDVQLSHPDVPTLERAAVEVAEALRGFEGVMDIDDGTASGKPQLDVRVKEAARVLGITPMDVGTQFRSSFFGAEAGRQQRGRDELKIYVRLPEEERESESDIESLVLQTRQGGEVPLGEAVAMDRGRSYTSIGREGGRRKINVTGDIDPSLTNAGQVIGKLAEDVLPAIVAKYPGMSFSFEGERREQMESLSSLGFGYMIALLLIYALLAIPFRSYIQPAVVMAAIPFGAVGAFAGHLIMGYDLSVISMMGIIALSGVVVNDSLVLVATSNNFRDQEGMAPRDAIVAGGVRRFRPILLTSLTTFFGLAPMILETSVQARFLIPMAISLGFGVLFATFVILILVPAFYMIVEDLKRIALWVVNLAAPEELDHDQGDSGPPRVDPPGASGGQAEDPDGAVPAPV